MTLLAPWRDFMRRGKKIGMDILRRRSAVTFMFEPIHHFSAHFMHLTQKFPVVSALFVFVATQLLSFIFRQRDNYLHIKRLRSGLHSEIIQNLKTAEQSVLNQAPIGEIKRLIDEKDDFRPLIIISYQSKFYDSVTSDLPRLRTHRMNSINRYYYSVMQVRNVCLSLESASFMSISKDGRKGLIEDIYQGFDECLTSCKAADEALRHENRLRRNLLIWKNHYISRKGTAP